MDITDLEESTLGTKKHWDEVYSRELQNFQECGDEGEIWFGKQCEKRVVEWITKSIDMNESILEFGSGNGHLLVSLAKKGFKNLRGLDYSEDAILLASEYAASTEFGNIGFFQADILAGFGPTISKVGVVLDKGTFDAMSLGPELDDDVMRRNEATQPRVVSICKKYKDALETITNPGASFIITSCNWTGDELIQLFGPEWESADEIKHPSFSFGGKLGNTVTSIVFNKRF